MAQLVFEIKNQWISRTDTFKPVAKSKNYLYAQFNFLTDEWVGVQTAIFRNKTSAYEQIIGQDGTCLVPWEVIDVEGDSEIFVSVFCGDLVTANKARVHVYDTGYGDDLESDTPPTPSVYEQILNRMAGIEEDMDDATQRAESAAESAEYAAEHYPIIMDEYWYVWDVIEHEYVDTGIKAEAHDGTSATVDVEQIVGGHRVIITDVSGEHVFDVPDGRDGTDGRGIASLEKTSTSGDVDQYTMTFSDDSEPFVYYVTNGASATISTRAITNGYRLTITDKNGTRAIDVLNGAKGDPGNGIQSINKIGSYENYDYYEIRMTNGNKTSFTVTNGYSPTVEIVNITGGHRVIITDKNGEHSFDVMDGQDYVLTQADKEEIAAMVDLSDYAKKTDLDGKVDKVTGKGLSTNDYTTEEKNKLADIEAQANKTVIDDALSDISTNPVQNKVIVKALKDKADIIISNASGTVASFPDGAEYDAVGLTAEFAPVQSGSGDPSPTNVRTIYGWTGLDICQDGENIYETAAKESGKQIDGSGNIISESGMFTTDYIPVTEGNVYSYWFISGVTGSRARRLYGYNSSKVAQSQLAGGNWINLGTKAQYSVTIPSGVAYIRISSYQYDRDVSLYLSGTGKTTPISWQTEAGEVFGGYVDVVRGKLIAEYGIASELWKNLDYGAEIGDNTRKTLDLTIYSISGNVADSSGLFWCNVTNAYIRSNSQDVPHYYISNNGRVAYIVLPNETDGNLEIQFCYKLATPIEYDIDPVTIELLKGYNNIWTSAGGNVSVEYKADTKLYIDGKQVDIRNTIAPIEDGATASQAYAIGKFFYRNGSFCKAKTAIASGATFTLGTNYEVTTVAAELFTALS